MSKKILIYLTIIFSCFFVFSSEVSAEAECNTYASQGEKVCESKTYNGYKCEWDGKKKGGSRCFNSKKLSDESKEKVTVCKQIKDPETCNNSTVKGKDCGWKQNGCRELNNTGTDETIIADDKEDREDIDNETGKTGNTDLDVQTGDPMTCDSLKDTYTYNIAKQIFKWIQIIAPIMLVVYGVIDFLTPVISGDNDAMKKAQSKFIKRCIIVAAIVLLPSIIDLLISLLDGAMGNNVGTCEINN